MKRILMSAVVVLSYVSVTQASAAIADPCADDIAKLCKDIDSADRNAVWTCLERYEDKLSDECRAYEIRMGGARSERRERAGHEAMFRKACSEEVGKFCSDAKGRDAAITCLSSHKAELSDACSAGIKAVREEEMNMKQ